MEPIDVLKIRVYDKLVEIERLAAIIQNLQREVAELNKQIEEEKK